LQNQAPNATDWIIAITAAVGVLSTIVATWVTVCQYKLKAKAENRLQKSARAEVDVRLHKLFAELMSLAHARGPGYVSETCIKHLLETGMTTEDDLSDSERLQKALKTCTFSLPVGLASQNAALASIGVLGSRYDVLREPARTGLNSLKSFKPEQAEQALQGLDRAAE